jgi:hypothetical protein
MCKEGYYRLLVPGSSRYLIFFYFFQIIIGCDCSKFCAKEAMRVERLMLPDVSALATSVPPEKSHSFFESRTLIKCAGKVRGFPGGIPLKKFWPSCGR